MIYEKIDDGSFKETKQTETVYTLKEIQDNIATLNLQIAEVTGERNSIIASLETQKKKFTDLLTEAEKLGVK